MKSPLRILHLEDNLNDAELIRSMLETNGIDCSVVRVETQDDFLKVLEQDGFDLIISDYTLPSFDGLSALKIAQQKSPDIPFIFVSGTIGEESAIESLLNGATDYVLKERLSRLVPAVHRALREREEIRERNDAELRYRLLAESAITGVYLIQDNIFRYVNPVLASIFGYEAKEIIDKLGPLDLSAPEDRPLILENIRKRVEGEATNIRYTFRGLRKDGTRIEVEVHGTRIEYYGKPAIIGTLLDITERKRAEEKIREQAELLDVDPDAILVLDLDGNIVFWSKGAERLYGWQREEILEKKWNDVFIEPENSTYHEARRMVLENGYWKGESNHVTKTDKKVVVESQWTLVRDVEGNPKSIYVVNTDVTEKKNLEAQYLRAQRMESLGSLAGGIAHDLNNLLSPILLSVEMLKRTITNQQNSKLLDNIEVSAHRGATLVKQILSFARGMEGGRVTISPKHIISEVVDVLKSTFPRLIRIGTDIPKELWTIDADPTQLHQVLMNLSVNARDAMPDGGKLTISADNVVVDEHYARMSVEGKPGSYTVLAVSDTGTGMPPDVQAKIFEPFFTTKETGKGTGLGLATVYSIVKGHGGFVNVYSEVGKGTTFKVYIPATRGMEKFDDQKKAYELSLGNGELILVVDDEAAIREITKATLENYGYRVIVAGDGVEALALFSQHEQEVKIAIIDMMMPSMDGKAAIKALHNIRPNVKVIAISGSAEEEERTAANREEESIRFLQKPFTAASLLQTVSELLVGP